MKKLVEKFGHALSGIWYALRHDWSFRTEAWLGGLILGVICLVFNPLSQMEMLSAALAFALILITELQNTALETALDRLHPELHDDIGKSKDMAAGAVLIAGLFALLVTATIIYNHFT